MKNLRLGIDFGGTKTEIIGLSAANGKELYRKRIPTVKGNYQQTLESFKGLVLEAEQSVNMAGTVGVCIPGSISDDTNTVKNCNATWVNGQPLQSDLEALLDRKIKVQNDANCFTVSEATDGAASGANVVFGVIIGTGCGGGVVIDGKPHKGVNGIGGEWGHNPLPNPRIYSKNKPEHPFEVSSNQATPYDYYTDDISWAEYPGPECFCGRRGCQELWISGTGFKMDYKRVTGEEISTHDIIANAKIGEEKAVTALNRYMDRLARALAVVINILDPDVIVLGGGMSNVVNLYREVPKIWGQYVFSDVVHTKLKAPIYGDSSGVRGAAWLWAESEDDTLDVSDAKKSKKIIRFKS